MNIKAYIESGALETYLLGLASEEEVHELLSLKAKHPEVKQALAELETDMERIASLMAIQPPAGTWDRIEERIEESIIKSATNYLKVDSPHQQNGYATPKANGQHFIEVEAESRHMRVHKSWKPILIAVFILGKIFLACAIYFYLENKHAQEQIQELKTELRLQKRTP